jgi:hypothetical protein
MTTTPPPPPPQHESVAAFLSALHHPLKPALKRVLDAIKKCDAKIVEEIKWNAPSYLDPNSGIFFATVNIHGSKKSKDAVLVVLHHGVKGRTGAPSKATIEDPEGLLDWLEKDRAVVKFDSLDDVKAKEPAFQRIIHQGIK